MRLSRGRLGVPAIALALLATGAFALPAAGVAPVEERVWATSRIARSQGYVVTPAFAANRAGIGFAAWVDAVGGKYQVKVARRSSKGRWSAPSALTKRFPWASSERWTWAGRPDVAVDQRGRAVAVWAQPKGGVVRIRTATYRKGGWSRPTYVSAPGDPASFPDVEVSADGHAVLTWAGNYALGVTDFTLMSSYRKPRGGWEAPVRLDTDPSFRLDARPDAPTIDDRGVATIAWDETNRTVFGTGRVQVASRAGSGGWTTQTLYQNVDRSDGPQVDTTPDGRLTAVWRDLDLVLARHRTPDGAWGPTEVAYTPAAGYTTNVLGVGVDDSGLSAVSVQAVQIAGNLVQPLVVLQGAAGEAWQQEVVADPYPQYSIPFSFEDLAVGPRGDVSVTWMKQDQDPDHWYWTGVRHRLPDGRWLPTVQVGRFAADPALASDGRGRLGVVFGDGYVRGGRQGCCVTLEAMRLAPR